MSEKTGISNAEFGKLSNTDSPPPTQENQQRNLEMVFDIPVSVSAEIGKSIIKIRDLINLSPGAVVELERLAGEPIDLLVNGVLIGKGDVVVVNENFGLRITEIVCTEERIKKLSAK